VEPEDGTVLRGLVAEVLELGGLTVNGDGVGELRESGA